ncbi:MAG: polyprenyl synthetase family protein [Candidatus Omnitrophica bacterium]|nr:polyprenyl synthetase family protein [Candidatus Omnitrophota bacterium]
MELEAYLKRRQAIINRALGKYLPSVQELPGTIHRAMRYSVLGPGKRIRPVLVLAACEAVGGKISSVMPAACAVELIHAYSLVHDDLPSMDNDDFRRGKPSCHKQFGEAIGILTGDALLTYSFQLLSSGNKPAGNGSASEVRLRVIGEVARAIGTQGMLGGQVADVEVTRRRSVKPQLLQFIHTRKTGALIAASVRVGALLGGASPKAYQALSRYGQRVGLVFQLVDDLLDRDGVVELSGEAAVRRQAERLTRSACAALAPLGRRGQPLMGLAEFILTRES